MYQAIPIEKFTGLRLDRSAVDVGAYGAVDALNVDLSQEDQLRVRPGSDVLFTSGTSMVSIGLVKFGSSYVTFSSGRVRTLDFTLGSWGATDVTSGLSQLTGGAQVASSGGANSRLYFAHDTTLRRFDGASMSTVAGSPEQTVMLALWKGRLVTGRGAIGGAAAQSRVSFSATDDGDTWGADDWIELDPNDGEIVSGMAVWNDELYVFKGSKFFVFYGISTDATGGAVFNYRTVNNGVGVASSSGRAVTAGRDGVYFIGRDGVYRTRGGAPERISQPIDPWFTGDVGGTVLARPTISSRSPYLVASARRVIMITTDWTPYVYEIDNGSWSVWDFNGEAVRAMLPADERGSKTFLFHTSTKFWEVSSAYSDDDGAGIPWRYQSGLYDIADGAEGVLRETALDGVGTVALKLSGDGTVFDTAGTVSLGSTDSRGLRRTSFRGRKCSHHLSGTATAFTRVSGVTHHMRDARQGR